MPTDSSRLADYASARRRELGLTRAQVHAAGGPSLTRLASVEEGAGPEPSATTLQKLDAGLNWEPGSAARIYQGGTPTDRGDQTGGFIGVSTISVTVDELANLIRTTSDLVAVLESNDARSSEAARSVQQMVSQLGGRWATEVLERNRRAGVDTPLIVEIAFGHLLNSTLDDVPEPERTERLYRRWLIGRTSGISSTQEAHFKDRLNRNNTAD